jgi:hypothetical protein
MWANRAGFEARIIIFILSALSASLPRRKAGRPMTAPKADHQAGTL